MIDLKQKELFEWQKRNFGKHDSDILRAALGMSEEVGEICHHVLKGVQKIREGQLGINKFEVADGVADALIYGLQILSLLAVDAEEQISLIIDQVLDRNWVDFPENGNKIEVDRT